MMVVEVRIDYEKCIGCKQCVEICAYSVLEWFEDKPVVVHPQNCAGCMECVSICPVEAIIVREK